MSKGSKEAHIITCGISVLINTARKLLSEPPDKFREDELSSLSKHGKVRNIFPFLTDEKKKNFRGKDA